MKKNHKLPLSMVLSGGVLLLILLAALLAPLSPHDPIAVETVQKFLPPSAQHLLGTDNFGRDTFTRLLYGGRVSLLVGFLSMLISIVFGTVYGIVSGSSGKLVDGFMMRIVDILMSVPSFLIIITLNIYMNAGIRTLVVTIGLFSWMGVARIVRAEVLSLRERDFILASEGLGARKSWVITRHFARNVFSPVLVASTNSIASAILTESSLSYLGFGISIPNPSWGGMLEGAQTYILTHPSLAVYPGVCILLTVLCFNVLGNDGRCSIIGREIGAGRTGQVRRIGLAMDTLAVGCGLILGVLLLCFARFVAPDWIFPLFKLSPGASSVAAGAHPARPTAAVAAAAPTKARRVSLASMARSLFFVIELSSLR